MVCVSVIIPTYNRAQVLPRAIDSVLHQTLTDLELIVVDDGSTDNTQEVIATYDDNRLKYIQHDTNQNASVARNTGIDNASGEFIAFLDSDDECQLDRLQQQVNHLQNHSEEWVANYCGVHIERQSRAKQILADIFDNNAEYTGQEDVIAGLLTLSGLMHAGSTLCVRQTAVEAINGFDERFDRHQDIEFTIRLAKYGKIGYVDEELVSLHESNKPSRETVANSKEILFEKFGDEIRVLKRNGYPVRKNHNFVEGRHYVRAGQFRAGFKLLRNSRPSTLNHLLGLGLDVFRGVKNKYV